MGQSVSAHIDAMLAAGKIDEDFAALEHRINDDSQSVQRVCMVCLLSMSVAAGAGCTAERRVQ